MCKELPDSCDLMNVCEEDPCGDRGICIATKATEDKEKGYTCACKDGYSGDKCEIGEFRGRVEYAISLSVINCFIGVTVGFSQSLKHKRT